MQNKKITQQQHTHASTEIVSYFLIIHLFYYDYSYVKLLLLLLLLLKFMCSCTSTRTITGQQQHEMVTTTTQSDLCKLLSVQELIFPIQQRKMNTSSEKLILVCTPHLIGGISEHFIWQVDLVWTLHLKTWPNSAICTCHLILGGISEHFFWLVVLLGHHLKTWPNSAICTHHLIWPGGYIWALNLTSWPTWTLHLKMWPNSAICTHHLIWWGVHLIWTLHLKIWTHFGFYYCFTEVFSMKDQSEQKDQFTWIFLFSFFLLLLLLFCLLLLSMCNSAHTQEQHEIIRTTKTWNLHKLLHFYKW